VNGSWVTGRPPSASKAVTNHNNLQAGKL